MFSDILISQISLLDGNQINQKTTLFDNVKRYKICHAASKLLGHIIRESIALVILSPILAFPPAYSTNDEHLRLMVATVDSGRLGPAGV